MQKLETTACQEADFMLNDAYCKLRKSPTRQSSLLIDPPPQYPNLPSPLLNDSTPLFNTSSEGNSPSPASPSTTFTSLSAGHHTTSPPSTLLASPSPSSSPTSRTTSTTITAVPTTLSENTLKSLSNSSLGALNHHPVEKRLASDSAGYGSPSKKTKLSPSSSSASLSSTLFSSTSSASFQVLVPSPSSSSVLYRHNHHHHNSGADVGSGGSNISGNGSTLLNTVLQQTQRLGDGHLCFSPTASSNTGHAGVNECLNIHDKLRELFLELLLEGSNESDRLSLRNTSFLLEKLILREQLNTLIVNLYPGNKGYSLAFRLGSQDDGGKNVSKTGTSANLTVFSTMGTGIGPPSISGNDSLTVNASDLNSENLQETIRWPYEEEDLLDSIDREELPLVLVDLLENKCPALFYCGCVVAEIRDYRQSFPIFTCDTFHVLLKPTNQTLLADVNILTAEGEWTAEDKLALESQLVLATAEPLCLDPNPAVGTMSINHHHRRQLLNTAPIRRQAKKFSQIAVNRKRKTDQFTHNFGLELSDFINKYRARPPRQQSVRRGVVSFTLPKKPSEVVPTVNLPNLELPELSIPSEVNVEKYARKYEAPKESRDCIPQLIEEYILETDRVINRGDTRVYHIKLSIFQRPSNSEYLGELYVDRDYHENKRNGEACQFSLGTRAHAHRYIQQFTEIFTEEGRKSVKITHLVPGQVPKVLHTAGMREQNVQQQQLQQLQQQQQQQIQQQQQQQTLVQQQISQIQQRLQSHPTQALLTRLQATNPALASQIATATGVNGNITLNATNPNTLPGNQSQQAQPTLTTSQPAVHHSLPHQQLTSNTTAGPNIISIGPAVSTTQPHQSPVQQPTQSQIHIQPQHLIACSSHQQQLFNANSCDTSNATTSVVGAGTGTTASNVTTSQGTTITIQTQSSAQQQQIQQSQPTQQTLNLGNGSLLLVQPSGQISNLTMTTNASGQQQLLATAAGAGTISNTVGSAVSGAQSFTFASGGQTATIINQTGARTLGSTVPLLVRLDNTKVSRDTAGNLISTISHQSTSSGQVQLKTQQQNLVQIQQQQQPQQSPQLQQQQQHQQQHQQQKQHQQQQQSQQTQQSASIHTTNPEIKAIAISIMNSANQFTNRQQQQQQQQSGAKSSSNAAILSLLNSAPAAMTNSPVLSGSLTLPIGKTLTELQQQQQQQQSQQQQQQQQHTIHHLQTTGGGTATTISGNAAAALFNSVGGRKINIQQAQTNQNRILNHTNLITVTGGTSASNHQTQILNIQAGDLQQQQQQQPLQTSTQTASQQQQSQQPGGNIRVTMSALATQLASPPAILTTSNLPQSFNVAAAVGATSSVNVSGPTVSTTNAASFSGGTALTSAGSKLIINNANQRVLNINSNPGTSTSTAAVVAAAFGGAIRRVSATGNSGTAEGIQMQIQGLAASQSSANIATGVNVSNIAGITSDNGLRRTVVPEQLQIQSIASPGSDHSNTSSVSLASNGVSGGGSGGTTGTLNGANSNNIIFNNMSGLTALLSNTTTSAVVQPQLATSSSGNGDGSLQNSVSVVGTSTLVGLGGVSNNANCSSNIPSTNSNSTACGSNNTNSALIERLTSSSSLNLTNNNLPAASPGLQFTIPSPKTPQQQSQAHIQIQSPAGSISPLSSPPPQVTIHPQHHQTQQSQHSQTQALPAHQTQQPTTVNLQGLNFASLHGAMTSIPGLQNVQVQIPGLAQPISLSLSSTPSGGGTGALNNTSAGNANQTTSLLVSVPVTNTTQVVNTINAGGTGNLLPGNSQTTQTVVLTNPQTSGSSLLSLPIAQIVTSGMKGLGQQNIRTGTPLAVNTGQPGQQIQLLNISQRPRAGQLPVVSCSGTTPITAKQLAARVVQHRQHIASAGGSALKIATPITGSHNTGQLGNNLNVTSNTTANQLIMSSKQLQLKLQQQHVQQHQQQQQQQSQQQQQHTQQIIAVTTNQPQPGTTQIHIQQQSQQASQLLQHQQQQQAQPQATQQINIINNTAMTPLSLPSPVSVTNAVVSQSTGHQNVSAITVPTASGKHRGRSAADMNK
ncbi:mucin-4 [Anopheles maculipalpis]|uniref:mucin-4 n=1 Tax=Anopheles maculipalpis TaxID=1496333 RepID=UPI002158FD85|nr:mucin-4 [Anopheles maculipalpis]